MSSHIRRLCCTRRGTSFVVAWRSLATRLARLLFTQTPHPISLRYALPTAATRSHMHPYVAAFGLSALLVLAGTALSSIPERSAEDAEAHADGQDDHTTMPGGHGAGAHD